MLHKLQEIIGRRDGEYVLSGIIELDDGFFLTIEPDAENNKPLKRGRGSQKKSKGLVMVESIPVEGKTFKSGK